MNKKYRKPLIAGNWKMNMLPSQAKPFAEELHALLPKAKTCDIAICPPFVIIHALRKALEDNRVAVGAQNVSDRAVGAYTGEVSMNMLADMGIKYVIVGHSERRGYYGETDTIVNAKVKVVLEKNVIPIICVGETEDQREKELTMEHIAYQVKAALAEVPAEKVRRCVFAYEPIWAIGTGKTATVEQAQEVCEGIRTVIRKKYGARIARSVRVLYGGSMNAGNAADLLAQPDIDGGLIGGASLTPADFTKIIEATNQE